MKKVNLSRSDMGQSSARRIRPVLDLAKVYLSDGRLAWPVAQANGVCCRTFRARLRRNWSPDAAVAPVWSRGRSSAAARVLPDGRRAADVAKAAGISPQTLHHRRKAGWPLERLFSPVGVYQRGRRPAVSPDVRLSDGRPALPVALAAGVTAKKFRDRIRVGMSPDEAVKPIAVYRLSDGRPAVPVARRNGVSRVEFLRRVSAGMSPDEAVQ